MPNDLEARTRRGLALAETMREASNPPYTDYEVFIDASEEWDKLMASGWPEEIARDWLRLLPYERLLASGPVRLGSTNPDAST